MSTPKEGHQQNLMKCVEAGDWAQAIAILEQLVQLEPANIQYHLKIGDYALKLKNPARATEEYRRAAEGFTQTGMAVKAMAVYKMILRLDPKDETIHQALHALRPTVSAPWALSGVPRLATKEALTLSLFASLTQEQFDEMVERLQPPQVFPADTVIIREGEQNDALYILIRGRVRVTTRREGKDVTLAELGDNEFFGELSHLTGQPRMASITAMTETEVLALQGQDITMITTRFPAVKDILVEYGLRRMRGTLQTFKEGEPS